MQRAGLRVGEDFFLAFSPERVDPGNPTYATHNIPKVVGGTTANCLALACLFYGTLIEKIVPVSSTATAEMVKLIENTFRSVNIALANEMALVCHKFGINVWEVIDAARTKPFGFMPFYPGPGLGGHCIPVDPYYLTWQAKILGAEPRLIELAATINDHMPAFVVSRIADALNDQQKSLKGAKILGLGVTYKRDVTDMRESPALEVLALLARKGAIIHYADPYVSSLDIGGQALRSLAITPETLAAVDCAVILADHSVFDYEMIAMHSPLLLDTRNALKQFSGAHILRL